MLIALMLLPCQPWLGRSPRQQNEFFSLVQWTPKTKGGPCSSGMKSRNPFSYPLIFWTAESRGEVWEGKPKWRWVRFVVGEEGRRFKPGFHHYWARAISLARVYCVRDGNWVRLCAAFSNEKLQALDLTNFFYAQDDMSARPSCA